MMSVKGIKTSIAAGNSRHYMKDVREYKGVDGRVYKTDKEVAVTPQRNTRIRTKEEHVRDNDKTTTISAIRSVESWLGGQDSETPTEEMKELYSLEYDEDTLELHGTSDNVFEVLKQRFPAASFYLGWQDLLLSKKNRHPVRTEPVKTYKLSTESHGTGSPKTEKPEILYPIGTDVWTYDWAWEQVPCKQCGGIGRFWIDSLGSHVDCGLCHGAGHVLTKSKTERVPVRARVDSCYYKKLKTGKLDVMYGLVYGEETIWKLQGNNSIFQEKEPVEARIQEMQEARERRTEI